MAESTQESRSSDERSDASTSPRGTPLDELPALAAKYAQSAADTALERIEEATQRALHSFETQRDLAANTLERLSNALGFVGAEAGTENERMAHVFGRTGERVRHAAEYVSAATPSKLKHDVSQLTRNRTGTAVGGFFLAGLALGRFLHASQRSSRRPRAGRPLRRARSTTNA
jgi:hypothetical protein